MMLSKYFSPLLLGSLLLALTACQSTDFDKTSKGASVTAPNNVTTEATIGERFKWGGTILEIKNKEARTELVVLSYPLNGASNPKLETDSNGRFIVIHDGYLEPLDYAKGAYVTVVGELSGFREGKISEANYHFPLLISQDMRLYKKNRRSLPFSISFGFSL